MSEKLDMNGITASLDELVKAADATKIVKGDGVNVETTGHVDERGKTSGGMASMGDAGSLDNMMIGKMTDALVNAGFDAADIAAFMSGGEDEDEEDEDKSEFEYDKSEGSFDLLKADKDIAEAVDVSPYLEALTSKVADQIDGVRKSQAGFAKSQANVNRATAAATYQIGSLVKGMAQVIEALNSRLNLVERTPVMQKGVTSLSGARPLSKALPGESGGVGQLKKSEIVATLSYMNLEKGIRDINGRRTLDVITGFEAGNLLDRQTLDAVQGFLAAHPAEEKTARSYC